MRSRRNVIVVLERNWKTIPDLTNLGLSSNFFPERRSHFSLISLNLQAICAVWQSKTGEYPFLISPGWLRMIT